MEKKICPNCMYENKADDAYCVNCGTKLVQIISPQVDSSNENNSCYFNGSFNHTSQGEYYQNFSSQQYAPDYNGSTNAYQSQNSAYQGGIDDISFSDYNAFIGAKCGSYVPKFVKMVSTGKKNSFNLPCLILGIIFGPVGCAFWYFYRKMYKMGFILLAIGLILSGIYACTSDLTTNILNDEGILSLTQNYEDIDIDELIDLIGDTSSENLLADVLLSTIESVINLVVVIFCICRANYTYFNHCRQTINRIKLSGCGGYYSTALASNGGTSVGMVFLCVALYIVGSSIISLITSFLPF